VILYEDHPTDNEVDRASEMFKHAFAEGTREHDSDQLLRTVFVEPSETSTITQTSTWEILSEYFPKVPEEEERQKTPPYTGKKM
jgi:hypothetical protein